MVIAVCAAPAARAGRVYRWHNAAGAVEYADRQPEDRASVRDLAIVPTRSEPGPLVRLRVTQEANGYFAWADNQLPGPVQVRLDFASSQNMRGQPALPARATLPAGGSTVVAHLTGIDPSRGGDFELRLDAIPGSPNARPRDVEYLYPLGAHPLRIEQGFGGRYSHDDDENHYAVDFAAAIGTEVVAARAGLVMQVENDFERAGPSREKYGGRANYIRILHDDGTMAVYAHLREAGVLVREGQRVRAGQLIGRSGNTGFTTGPHLHFAVQVNRGMRLVSIPFRMFSGQGILRFTDPVQRTH